MNLSISKVPINKSIWNWNCIFLFSVNYFCAAQDGKNLYIFWENDGRLARLDLHRHSITYLPAIPFADQMPRYHCGFAVTSRSLFISGGFRDLMASYRFSNPHCTVLQFNLVSNEWSLIPSVNSEKNHLAVTDGSHNRPRALHGCEVVFMWFCDKTFYREILL